jgi:hypothetical protein
MLLGQKRGPSRARRWALRKNNKKFVRKYLSGRGGKEPTKERVGG